MHKKTLAMGDYVAEIYFKDDHPVIYHYLVTRLDSTAILAWGQELSAERAERVARQDMERLQRQAAHSAKAG